MARKGLPRKYAKHGFKKGWRLYKAAQRVPVKRKKIKRKPVYKRRMARRRKYSKKKKRYSKKSKSILGMNLMNNIAYPAIAGGASGFIDGFVNQVISLDPTGITRMLPVNYTQALVGVLAHKYIPIKQIRPIIKKYIEFKIAEGSRDLTQGIAFGTMNGGAW